MEDGDLARSPANARGPAPLAGTSRLAISAAERGSIVTVM